MTSRLMNILHILKSLIEYDVRTNIEGLSQILSNGDLFVEESYFGRTLYFNANGSLRWSHLNRANNGMVNRVGWSRILYTKKDLEIVNSFLRNRRTVMNKKIILLACLFFCFEAFTYIGPGMGGGAIAAIIGFFLQ